MDDFEIYLRAQTYELKLQRTVEKFITRLKWLPVSKTMEMFKDSHELMKKQREHLFEDSKAV